MTSKFMKRFFIIGFLFLLIGCDYSQHYIVSDDQIYVESDPIQKKVFHEESVFMSLGKRNVTISPKAEYILQGIIRSKKFYHDGLKSEIAPLDLAIVWGGLAGEEIPKDIRIWQSNRWYYWRYSADSPYQNDYIIPHSSNNHIIPANDTILMGMEKIKNGDIVKLSGYLVNVDVDQEGKIIFWWHSSLTRGDIGNASCEVFYVKELQIGDKLFY